MERIDMAPGRIGMIRDALELPAVTDAKRMTGPRTTRSTTASSGRVDVLQANLAAGHELAVLGATDLDLPELLRAPLLDRRRDDLEAPGAVGSQEVRAVGHAHRLLPVLLDRLVAADGPERLDRRRVEAAVDDAPGLVVAVIRGDRAPHARRRDLIEARVDEREEFARVRRRAHGRTSTPTALAARASRAPERRASSASATEPATGARPAMMYDACSQASPVAPALRGDPDTVSRTAIPRGPRSGASSRSAPIPSGTSAAAVRRRRWRWTSAT